MVNFTEWKNKKNIPNVEIPQRKEGRYQDAILKHRMTILIRALVIIVVIVAIAAIFWISKKNKIYTEYETGTSVERTAASNASTAMLGNCILTYSNDGANCSDAKGKVIWNETFEMQNPVVSISNSTVAIGNYNGRQIFVMNTQGSLGEITTNLPLRALSVADNGTVAAILDDTDITWIYLYSAKGEELAYFKTTMSQSGYPVDVSISANSNLVAVSYLAADNGDVKSSVAFYNFGEVGQNEIDNYMSGYDYQAVVPTVKFMTSSLAYALANDRLMFYEGAQKPVSKSEVLLESEVQSVFHNSEYVALVTYDISGTNKYILSVYDSQGNAKLQKGFDVEYKNIILTKENIYIYSESECVIYNIFGVEKYAGTFDDSISLIVPDKRVSSLVLVSQKRIAGIHLR